MEIVKKLSRRKNVRLGAGKDPSQYPHTLQFYSLPPTENISLQDFENFAVERLKVLKVVETVGLKYAKSSQEYQEAMKKELKALKTQGIMKGITAKFNDKENISEEAFQERRQDHISHFILRLAYCRSEDLRRWFLSQEVDLFRYRFGLEDDKSIQGFLEENKLHYKPISKDERQEILLELTDSSAIGAAPADVTNFYKVPFTDALDLVKGRRVYLKKGNAYVPHNELIIIILSVFRSRLSQALAVTSRSLPQLEEDSRLLPMLSGLSKRYLGQDYTNKKPISGSISAGQIDQMAQESYPLCMASCHEGFRQTHHLRHGGRMQYGLFLKGIGVSLEEAMKFWRAEFTKAMDSEKFEKSYSYGIRHNYGKEGKRANYTPYSCVKIITTNTPGPGDFHGCPFKHTDVDILRQKLQGLGMSKDLLDEVCQDVKGGHYGIACGRYFNFKHKSTIDFTPTHPNEYFDTSRKLKEGLISSEGIPTQHQKPTLYFGTPKSQNTDKSSQDPSNVDMDDLSMEDISQIDSLTPQT